MEASFAAIAPSSDLQLKVNPACTGEIGI
jgi:hypothetical protein